MGNVTLPPLSVQNLAFIPTKPTPYASIQKPSNQPDLYINIVSHSHLLREALILLLQSHWSIHVINHDIDNHDTDTIDSAAITANDANHLILLDSSIGHRAVIAQIQEWRSLQFSPYIVVLELKNDPDLILDCIEAGAHGYALQSASSAEVIQVIEQVYRGIAHCSPEITAKLFDRLTQSRTVQQPKEKPPLTRRELEVLHYVARNYSNRDIAAELIIEIRTVKHHVHNILRKLGVEHRRDAAQLAIRSGWLNLISP
jgi:DNA-binding NarL/FixJ family response regulator